jgi:hypothetical protein
VNPSTPVTKANIDALVEGTVQTLENVVAGNYSPNKVTITDTICLYMPDTLSASYNASYDQLSLTTELGAFGKGIQAFTAMKDLVQDKSKGSPSASDPIITKLLTDLGVGAANYLGSKFGAGIGQGAKDLAVQQQGYAINPQMQMIYRGMDFRQFQLSFLFTPASSQEAGTVNQIITTFKYHFSPSLLTASNAIDGMFFVPPAIFNLQFMFNNSENLYLPKYGDCVLRDIDVNYAPSGFAAHNDGAPVQTQLTLTFQEIEIVTKEKLATGYFSNVTNASQSSSGSVVGLR